MRKIIDFLIKNIHSLTFTLLLLFSLAQVIDKNYYQSSKFNFYSNSLVNLINEEKQSLVEYPVYFGFVFFMLFLIIPVLKLFKK